MSATPQHGTTNTLDSDLVVMMEEVGTAVATGLVPLLGQGINVYDTIESLFTLHKSVGEVAIAEAKFDLILALVGWVPGAGGGVKKTFRMVNRHPERFAPILFDVLRMVCAKLGIQTSPESLLDQLFNATGLKTVLKQAQSSIEQSWAFEKLPSESQAILSSSMNTVSLAIPAMLMIVTMKLTRWKKMQRNTAARNDGAIKKDPGAVKPEPASPHTGVQGTNSPTKTSTNTSVTAVLGTAPLEVLTNSVTGIVGEHITDYFLYEEFGWGKNWSGHDRGDDGKWLDQAPSRICPGKLNEKTKLNKLFAIKAHGVGIDGVWSVEAKNPNNEGKPYAIVESKASKNEKAPRNPARKPRIKGKLLDNLKQLKKEAARAAAEALPKPTDLLDPAVDQGNPSSGTGAAASGKPAGGSKRGGKSKKSPPTTSAPSSTNNGAQPIPSKVPIVQMSRAWIDKNIARAVPDLHVVNDFRRKGAAVYSRHLFYTPFYLPAAFEHAAALRGRIPGQATVDAPHTSHAIPPTHRYNEAEVLNAVNAKRGKLGLQPET